MKQETLEKAALKLKNGDISAFDYIYDRTYKVVFFAAHEILKERHTAEDITQETYITAYKNMDSYASGNLLAWLVTIAKRLAINAYNREKRSVSTDFTEEGGRFKDESPMPDEDSFGLIGLAEKLLGEEDFNIVIMCAVSGYKRREAAQLLGMPVSTVSYRYSQSLKILKDHLEKGGAQK